MALGVSISGIRTAGSTTHVLPADLVRLITVPGLVGGRTQIIRFGAFASSATCDCGSCQSSCSSPSSPSSPNADAIVAARRSAFANPVLIGAVTVLALLIAVFLAYNANQGLPFVPTKELKVDIANGANLLPGNDVREGGFRIGVVSDMKPIELPNGQVGAQLILRLDQAYGNVPADSTVSIRPASVLGVKYVYLEQGISKQSISDGGTLPLGQTNVPVQFDDISKLFDARTRPAVQQNLAGFGDALAARGSALNDTIASLPALFVHLRPVAAYLSDPNTQLTRLLGSLG